MPLTTFLSIIPFAEPSLFYVLLPVLDWFARPDVTTTLFCQEIDVTPPRYCDFPEELVADDGIKTLGPHLRATCTERSAAHFREHLF